MKRRMSLFFFAPVALLSLGAFAQQGPDISKLRFWVEPAEAVRGPDHYGEDNIFTSWEKSRGHFIGYTANACWHSEGNCTAAVEGLSPGDAGAPPVSPQYHKDIISNDGLTVPAWGRCGQWLNSVLSRNGKLYAFVHGENPAAGDTTCSHYSTHHKTMALWTSSDGLAWHDPVEIIDAPGGRPNGESGEGDCTAIAADGFAYLFCRRTSDTNSGVARKPLAELADPRVGFVKYNHDWGEESGLHGMDSPLPGTMAGTGASTNRLGSSASVWKDRGWVMLLNVEDIAFGGLKVSFTTLPNLRSNAITFTTLPEPLFVEEPDTATGSYPYETHPTRNLCAQSRRRHAQLEHRRRFSAGVYLRSAPQQSRLAASADHAQGPRHNVRRAAGPAGAGGAHNEIRSAVPSAVLKHPAGCLWRPFWRPRGLRARIVCARRNRTSGVSGAKARIAGAETYEAGRVPQFRSSALPGRGPPRSSDRRRHVRSGV